ncbi:hypothetical protein C2W64_01437 [Brevibacillus laterosporus]|nr:hypothetical protein C2W64_01437 [Brevibacillus laterosporus]
MQTKAGMYLEVHPLCLLVQRLLQRGFYLRFPLFLLEQQLP